MSAQADRPTQVFIWKEGERPSFQYSRDLISRASPGAQKYYASGDVPSVSFVVDDNWPADFWERVIADLEVAPAPAGTSWVNSDQYELVGWQGVDSRTGNRLFVVTAFPRERADNLGLKQGAQRLGQAFATQNGPIPSRVLIPLGTGQLTKDSVESGLPSSSSEEEVAARQTMPVASAQTGMPHRLSSLQTVPLGHESFQESVRNTPTARVSVNGDRYSTYYAGFGPRLAAQIIDLGFILVFPLAGLLILYLYVPESPIFATPTLVSIMLMCGTLLSVFIAYHVLQVGLWGQTVGKKLMGIKVVTIDGDTPSFSRTLLRWVGFVFSLVPLGLGLALIALDVRRQGLHDRIAETFVVHDNPPSNLPTGLPGYARRAVGVQAVHDQFDHQGHKRSGPAAMASVAAAPASRPEHLDNHTPAPDAGFFTGPFVGFESDSSSVVRTDRPKTNLARALFKTGLSGLQSGVVYTANGYRIDPAAARVASASFKEAVEMVPSSVLYRYFSAVAQRHAEGFPTALREFRLVLEADPGNFEAQRQIAYGPRWHDSFSYPAWPLSSPEILGVGLPAPITDLLPATDTPVTRLILMREGANKLVAFLSRTPSGSWSVPPQPHMNAGVNMLLSRTTYGPVLALYITLADNVHSPYVGETFLNPRESAAIAQDACLLGQHVFEQLARQDHTYAIFVDEHNRLLLSRKLTFDTRTQVLLARVLYEVQTLPAQPLDSQRYFQAAQWHMEHISLEDIAEQFRPI
jgi:uncharacterized RDD family membrane protein YckC